jgi:hypothetical protein
MKNYARKIDYYTNLISNTTDPYKISYYLEKLRYFVGRQNDAIDEMANDLLNQEPAGGHWLESHV